MRQQVPQLDAAHAARAEFGNQVADLHVEMQGAALDAVEHHDVGELFADGERHEGIVEVEHAPVGSIRVAVHAAIGEHASAADAQRRAVVAAGGDIRLDAGRQARESLMIDAELG
jgi:hypothetical protein